MEQYLSLWPTFWEGFRVTLLLLAVSGVLSLILGTIIAAMRISPPCAERRPTPWRRRSRLSRSAPAPPRR